LALVASVPVAATLAAVPATVALGTASTLTACEIGIDKHFFGVRVLTDLYEPEYPQGSIAVIDPALAPENDGLSVRQNQMDCGL
jgi:hypothetical protein